MQSTVPYAGVTLLSAFLLFLVEPLLARRILPWFGGAQSVWTVCLVFYQTALLAGYLYSHVGRRLGTRRQALLHVGVVGASALLLPLTVSERWKPGPGTSPAGWLLGLLTTSVGGPYLVLASTAPLVQGWFARLRPGRSPYWLYALSNAGSLVALLAYPAVIEPLLPVSGQSLWWSWGYAAFVVACVALSLAVARAARAARLDEAGGAAGETSRPQLAQVLLWLALAACGSGLLLALTNHMTMDVAAVPFLWVLPLAIYLVTYVLAFAGVYRRATWGALLVVALAAMGVLWDVGFALPLPVQLGASAAVLFTACMVCHGELARAAPPAGQVTAFYVMVAAGGALGGIAVALVAPRLLRDLWELPGFLLLSFGLLTIVLHREYGERVRRDPHAPPLQRVRTRVLAFVLIAAAFGFVVPSVNRSRGTLATRRNFYGVLRVQDAPEGILKNQRVLSVGRIFHGGQFIDPARRREATAYYVRGSGPEQAIDRHPKRVAGGPLRIGVIGLGVGTMAAWAQPGDTLRYYEINPAVDDFASRYFSFLKDSRAATTVVLGDGRLSLEGELASARPPRYDVFAIDAFSGDAVPVHLLTREAGLLYTRVLEPDGVIAFNVTNRHVQLERVVRGLAAELDFPAVVVRVTPAPNSGATPSAWVLLTRNRAMLEALGPGSPASPGRPILWTDDFSNLLQVLR